jgi:glucosamine-6-phosphate deaminase
MKLHIFHSTEELYRELALRLAGFIQKPLQLGFATGKTMEPLYAQLRLLAPLKVQATGWILDEYLGLKGDHPQSYRYFLNHYVFGPLNFPPSQISFPPLDECPIDEAIKIYEDRFLKHQGLDLQLLGLGLNGHVGLNEPGSKLTDRTRVVEIAELTRKSNLVYFNDISEVPSSALTFGLANLLQDKELWLIVTGSKKAEIVKKVVEGEVSTEVPASLLKNHKNLNIFLDPDAAQLLKPIA